MGWEPTTTYTYDEQGRLISTTVEPEWDEVERDWMLALQYYRDEVLCPMCGLEKAICRAQATAQNGAVVVGFERCHITAAISVQDMKNRDQEVPHPESLLYSATVRDPDGS